MGASAPGDVVTYAITLGNDDGAFAMGAGSGEITVAGALDHESVPSYSLMVEASTERSGTTTAIVEITVTDVLDEAPPAPAGLSASLADGTFTIDWDAVAGAVLYEAQHRIAGSSVGWAVVGTTTAHCADVQPSGGAHLRHDLRVQGAFVRRRHGLRIRLGRAVRS